jgi:hypothetical protein
LADPTNLNAAEYVTAASRLVGLPIRPEYRDAVIEDMSRIASVAAVLTEFPLPPETEAAPVFEP